MKKKKKIDPSVVAKKLICSYIKNSLPVCDTSDMSDGAILKTFAFYYKQAKPVFAEMGAATDEVRLEIAKTIDPLNPEKIIEEMSLSRRVSYRESVFENAYHKSRYELDRLKYKINNPNPSQSIKNKVGELAYKKMSECNAKVITQGQSYAEPVKIANMLDCNVYIVVESKRLHNEPEMRWFSAIDSRNK